MRRSPSTRCSARIGPSLTRTTTPQMSNPAMGRAVAARCVSTVIASGRSFLSLGDLLRDVGIDPLVGLLERGFAGHRLTNPADHRVEYQTIVGISLQPEGQRRHAADALAE